MDYSKSGSQEADLLNTESNVNQRGVNMMNEAYEIVGTILKGNLTEQARSHLQGLKRENVLVVPGKYDQIGGVLNAAGIDYVEGRPTRANLQEAQVVIVNCPGNELARRGAQVRDWVASGGRLLTTDWAVEPLQKMFPNYIQRNGQATGDEHVLLDRGSLGGDQIMVGGIVPEQAVWWLETASYPFKVARGVEVILTSKELERRYGSSLVAVQWDYGQGKVRHMISHLYLQRPELRSAEDHRSFTQSSYKYGLDQMSMAKLSSTINLDEVPDGAVAASLSAVSQLVSFMTAESSGEDSGLVSRTPGNDDSLWVN